MLRDDLKTFLDYMICSVKRGMINPCDNPFKILSLVPGPELVLSQCYLFLLTS